MLTLHTRITAATAKESSRYAINGFHVGGPIKDRPNTVLVTATDGRMLACTYGTTSNGGFPSGIVGPLKGSGTSAVLKREGDRIIYGTGANEKIAEKTLTTKPQLGATVEGSFPPFVDVLPAVDDDATIIGLNAELLARLAEALGSDAGTVFLAVPKNPTKPIAVVATTEGHTIEPGIGVLMPVKLATVNHATFRNAIDAAKHAAIVRP